MKEKHEDTNMKKKTLHPIMIALLALFVLLQAFCLTAFGAEYTEVCIPAGTDTEIVNQILTDTLLPDSEETLKLEYECVGKEDGGYKVGTGEKEFSVRKAAKHTVDFKLRQDQRIPLIYDEDGTFNSKETKEEIFTRVFSASNADFISCEDVTIQYYG